MVRRRLVSRFLAAVAGLVGVSSLVLGCAEEREMKGSLEMPDTALIMRAIRDAESRDALLDTMPGGEMARGDSAAEFTLLKKKM